MINFNQGNILSTIHSLSKLLQWHEQWDQKQQINGDKTMVLTLV